MRRIYLDHAASTPLLPEARDAMAPWLGERCGNPSSLHAEGRKARQAVDESREILSSALGCLFAEVVFTSGGTEAANLAVLGVALANADPARKRVLMSAVEHHCVLHTRPLLERLGYRVEVLPVDRIGRLRWDSFEAGLKEDVLLVSLMHANNELGTIQPVAEVSEMARRVGAMLHCDAAQTFPPHGSPPYSGSGSQEAPAEKPFVELLGADLVSLSAHKAYGPKGAGALYVRAGVRVSPLAVGGGQERELRAGTENVAAIVGFAEAIRRLRDDPARWVAQRAARDAFLDALLAAKPEGLELSVPKRDDALDGHAHLRFRGIAAESMLIQLDRSGVSASSGAACSSGSLEPSHVLLACGYSTQEAREGLRFTFGIGSSEQEAREAAARVLAAVERIRAARRERTR